MSQERSRAAPKLNLASKGKWELQTHLSSSIFCCAHDTRAVIGLRPGRAAWSHSLKSGDLAAAMTDSPDTLAVPLLAISHHFIPVWESKAKLSCLSCFLINNSGHVIITKFMATEARTDLSVMIHSNQVDFLTAEFYPTVCVKPLMR